MTPQAFPLLAMRERHDIGPSSSGMMSGTRTTTTTFLVVGWADNGAAMVVPIGAGTGSSGVVERPQTLTGPVTYMLPDDPNA